MGLLVSFVALFVGYKFLQNMRSYRTIPIVCFVYTLFYMSQVLIGSILYVNDRGHTMSNLFNTSIEESLLPFSFAAICVFGGLYIGVKISRIEKTETISLISFLRNVDKHYNIDAILVTLLFFFSCSILRTLNAGYIINLIANTFTFATIIVGFFWNRMSGFLKVIWIVALSVTFVFHMIQGSRGYALFPIIFLLVGRLLTIANDKKKLIRRLSIYTAAVVLFLPMFSRVQNYRQVMGRGLDVSVESFNSMIDFLFSEQKIESDNESGLSRSLSRFITESNFAAVVLTPSVIPHFGFVGMDQEFASIVTLVGSSNEENYRMNRADMLYGYGIAARYGFNITELNSVEFPMLADSYARFGYLGVLIYSLLFAFIMCKLEILTKKINGRYSLLGLMLFTLLIYSGALSYGSSYAPVFKALLFRGAFVAGVAYIMSFMFKKTHSESYGSKIF